jgi:cation/acetate symporter
MSSEIYAKIRKNPKFDELVSKRTQFATILSAVVLTGFYGFVLVVAFSPTTLAAPLSEGSYYTVGVAAIFSMFIAFWILVALYVRRANTEFDALTAEVIKAAQELKS